MTRPICLVLCLTLGSAVTARGAAAPAPSPSSAPAALDAATEAKLVDVDARAGKIKDFTARFEQRKFTALLRKPLVSTGVVRSAGKTVRWDTEKPDPSVLYSDGAELKMYYPKQKLLEVYPVDRRMTELAASPVPRLAALRENFAFEPMAAADVLKDAPGLSPSPDRLAVRLRPTGDFLRKHVREVRVLLDVKTALMLCAVTVDADGDRTVIRISDPKPDTGLKADDLRLNIPAGTQVSRPLEGVEGGK